MNIKLPGQSDIPALRNLWKEAFGDTDEFLDVFFSVAFSCDRAMCVTSDGEMMGALYWFNCEHCGNPVAYVYAVATAKAKRGQGICHKLMEHTHNHLKCLGYKGVILVPGSRELFEFYKGMGYETCSFIKTFNCKAGETPVSIQPIDKTEYAQLRREYLPRGGVVQENENIDFLDTFTTFYKGEGFVLAGRQDNGVFYGTELLGNTAQAQGILKPLNCREGEFRTYGENKPFSMYYPLENSTETPQYFGLAFD